MSNPGYYLNCINRYTLGSDAKADPASEHCHVFVNYERILIFFLNVAKYFGQTQHKVFVLQKDTGHPSQKAFDVE